MALDNARLHDTTQQEIAERRRFEAASLASETRFRTALEGSLDAIFIYEVVRDTGKLVDLHCIDMNPPAERMMGCPRDMVIGKSVLEFSPSTRTNGTMEKVAQVLETGMPLEEEVKISVPSMTAIWLHRQIVRFGDGVIVSARDITARKQTETSLATTRDLFASVLEAASDAFVMCNLDGHIILTNRAVGTFFGIRDTDLGALRSRPAASVFQGIDDEPAFIAQLCRPTRRT